MPGRPRANLVRALARVSVAIFMYALIAANFARGEELRCPARNVVVHSADRDGAETACQAAGDAIDFLTSYGLDTTRAVEMHLVKQLPDIADKAAVGCYDHRHRRIYMLIFLECSKQETLPQLPLDHSLYASLLTHEVAHAVAAENFSISKPSIRAQEYLAYVTMFATMQPKQRGRMLERFPGEGFDSVDQISTTLYLINPFRFGVEAYRHFLKPGNGKAFLKEVLSGRALIGEDDLYR